MNPRTLIPAIDPTPLPAPVWLFHLLWVVTFAVHLFLVNAVLGGSLLSAAATLFRRGSERRAVASFFLRVNTWAIAFAITFAIAPLLFLQVLYGRFFYTATVLVAWGWLAMLGMVMMGYYLNYAAKHRLARGVDPGFAIVLQAILFLAVAGTQVAVNLLHAQPQRWEMAARTGWSILGDPSFAPRFLHFVFAAVAIAGGALAWWSVKTASSGGRMEPFALSPEGRFGLASAVTATALQIPVGFWLLFALPREVLIGLMRGGAATMAPFGLGILLGVGALVVLALGLSPLAKPRLIRHGLELMTATALLMIVTRHQVREAYLEAWRRGETLTVSPQWGVFALFVILLLASVALTVWALVRSARERPLPGEPTA